MSEVNLFEQASRLKLRFDTVRGTISVEDLWDLPLTSGNGFNLDRLAIELHEQLQSTSVSFVTGRSQADTLLNLKFELVKHVIGVRLQEQTLATQELDKAAKRKKLAELIERRKEENLSSKSLEELQAELDAL